RIPMDGVLRDQQRRTQESDSGGKLLYGSTDNRVSFGLIALVQNGAEAPQETAQLQDDEAIDQRGAERSVQPVWGHQQNDSDAADHDSAQRGQVDLLTARKSGSQPHHPERSGD